MLTTLTSLLGQSPARRTLTVAPLTALAVVLLLGTVPALAAVPTNNVFPIVGRDYLVCSDDFGAGRSEGRTHQGNDCFAPTGTPLVAVENGFIEEAQNTEAGLGGITLWLKGDSGTSYYYAHNSRNIVRTDGARVSRGQVIAEVGNTGNARTTPPHLHFQIHPNGRGTPATNPRPHLRQWSAAAPPPPPPAPRPRDEPGTLEPFGNFAGGTTAAVGDLDGDGRSETVVGAGPGAGSHVQVLRHGGDTILKGFFAYPDGFAGGVDVAVGDVDGDGKGEIITGAGPGGGPQVRIFRASDLQPVGGFFAYSGGYPGGVNVSAGDVDGDGRAEIITGSATSSNHVRVFDAAGNAKAGWFPYGAFGGGTDVAAADTDGDGRAEVITGAGSGGGPHVLVHRITNGTPSVVGNFMAYPGGFSGGVRVSAADRTFDGKAEIITGAGPGGGPHVRVLRPDGSEVDNFYPFNGTFAGGVDVAAAADVFVSASWRNDSTIRVQEGRRPFGAFAGGTTVARGDLNGDGRSETVVGAGPGAGSHVRVFNGDGNRGLGDFFAYPEGFAGGVDVAIGDVDGDGKGEIITGAGYGGGPQVRIFRASDLQPIGGFFAYADGYPGGVNVSAGDIDGDGRAEIITGSASSSNHVRVFDAAGNQKAGWFPYGAFDGGTDVAAADTDGDGRAEVITGAAPGGGPHVLVHRITGGTPSVVGNFMAYPGGFPGGVRVSAADRTGDGKAEIITGAGPGGGPHVRVFTPAGVDVGGEFAFADGFSGGVDVAAARDGVTTATWRDLAAFKTQR
jgi:hypothetical protein